MVPLLQPFVDKHELAGAVALVAAKDKVLSVEMVGFADIAQHKAMAPDALFWIASQSKAMTATAVLMLVDEGKIALDDPVEKLRGNPTLAGRDHHIAEAHLLDHYRGKRQSDCSGLPFKSAVEKPTLYRPAARRRRAQLCGGTAEPSLADGPSLRQRRTEHRRAHSRSGERDEYEDFDAAAACLILLRQ